MIVVGDEKTKKKMQMDGSVLKYMRDGGGLGKGLIGGGITWIIMLLFVMGLLGFLMEMDIVRIIGITVLVCSPGIIMIVAGIFLRKSRLEKAMQGYMKASGLSREELEEMDREFMQPGTKLFAYTKTLSGTGLKNVGFITEHYLKMPGAFAHLFRIDRLVACFYTNKIPDDGGDFHTGFIVYDDDESRGYGLTDEVKEKTVLEIVEEIARRNPSIITAHHFVYEGKQYDALNGCKEVIALHNRFISEQ